MSTQLSPFPAVPFSITHPQQGFRLLELPPELLDLLTSDEKPAILQLKSATTTTTSTNAKDHFLHLCTEDKVWAIRQVSTSNSVFITEPATLTASRHDDGSTDPDPISLASTGVTAICQPTSALELIPLPATEAAAETAIRATLPDRDIPSANPDDDDLTSPNPPTLSSLLDNIPLPDALLKRTLRALFVCEAPSSQATRSAQAAAFIPSPHLLLRSYRIFHATLLSTDTGPGADLASFTLEPSTPILAAIAAEEGAIYAAVARAILDCFINPTPIITEDKDKDESHPRNGHRSEGRNLNAEALTTWLGTLLLRCTEFSQTGIQTGIEVDTLFDEWTECVPREWWVWCDVARLHARECWGGVVKVVDGRVRLTMTRTGNGVLEPSGGVGVNASSAGAGSGDGAGKSAVPPGKRKWHERFSRDRTAR